MSGHAGQDRTRERIELERDLATQRAKARGNQCHAARKRERRAAYIAEVRRTLYEREAQADLKRQRPRRNMAKAGQRERLTT
jgi:hemolysin D